MRKISSLNENSTSIELTQMLIPLGLQAIEKELQSEVSKLAGARHIHTHPDLKRWICARGISIFRRSDREYHASGGVLQRTGELLEKQRSEATMGRDSSARNRAKVKNCRWLPPSQKAQRGNEGLEF